MNKIHPKSHIKNIVFDIGNVLVKWSPESIINQTFDDSFDHQKLFQDIFKHNLWKQLNKGEFTENVAKELYCNHLCLESYRIDTLFENIKTSQNLLVGTHELLKKLHTLNYQLYALTNNVIEIIDFLKQKYDFWQYFNAIVTSGEVGYLKPNPQIYNYLLNQYSLLPQETLFIDDCPTNIEGAKLLDIQGIQFFDSNQCENALRDFIDFL